jgi:sugar phosphate isomerase/epimerase
MYDFSDFGLCCGSIAQADFRELAECASRAGFRFITLWPSHFDRAREAGLSVPDMRAILADNEVSITELDPLCSWLPTRVAPDDIAASFYAYRESDFFKIADALGARSLNVIQASPEPVERNAVIDAFGALCDRAEKHGLTVSVEFLPWSPIGNLAAALDLVTSAGRSNCGVNVDTWHHFRSGGTISDLATLDPSSVAAIQFNDVNEVAWEDPLQETARGRLLPGQGVSDSAAVLEAFYGAGVRVPINVEVFSAQLQELSPERAALGIAQSTRSVLALAGAGR